MNFVSVIADWIAAEPEQSQNRFTRLRDAVSANNEGVDNPLALVPVLLTAVMDQRPEPRQMISAAKLAKLVDPDNWRERGQLLFEVVDDLARRGVVFPGVGGVVGSSPEGGSR